MKVSFRDSIFSSSSRCRELSDVIADISSGVHKELIEKIRVSEKNKGSILFNNVYGFVVNSHIPIFPTIPHHQAGGVEYLT